MPRYRLSLEYVGTRYRGWQIQKNARTVQGELRQALEVASGESGFELYGSGRTDAGVHALLQVAHVDLRGTLPPSVLRMRVNDALPPDINVLAVERAAPRFHARHGAVGRSYLYQVARRRTAFAKPFVWWVRDPLDVEAIRQAAAALVGRHDFRSFTDVDPEEGSTLVHVAGVEAVEEGALVLVRVQGSHFLWKMVRRIVGVLVEVGRGGLAVSAVPGLLRVPSDLPARLTALPSGLFLERVSYEGDPPLPAPRAVTPLSAAAPGPSASLGRAEAGPPRRPPSRRRLEPDRVRAARRRARTSTRRAPRSAASATRRRARASAMLRAISGRTAEGPCRNSSGF